MPIYHIKDLENLTGILSHTIRVWEQRYKLLNPERTPTNIRCYSDRDVQKLLCVSLLIGKGYRISKIASMTDAEINRIVLQLSKDTNLSIESVIDNLKLITVDMSEPRFDKLFGHLLLQVGFEEAIMTVFVPFFRKLFLLWQTKTIKIAHINFITSLYKQKLYVTIDGLIPPEKPVNQTFIMFLPPMEHVDNGLLFCNYMAKKRGFQTLYLGASFPAEELPDILEKNPECYLFSVATLVQTDLTAYYTKILSMCSQTQKLLLAGYQTGVVKITDPRLTVFHDYMEFRTFLDQL